jgi:hypothetical protein
LTQGSHTLKLVFDTGLIDLNWREFSQSSTPTPITPVSCHQYTPGPTIPIGFSVPCDTQSGMNELLIKATCQDTTAATLDFGRGVSTQYIYKTGYHYHAGMAG